MKTPVQAAGEFLFGICGGCAAAAGVFAMISVVGMIPRMAGCTHTGKRIHGYEWAVILGGTVSNLWYLAQTHREEEMKQAGRFLMQVCRVFPLAAEGIMGLAIGAFVGSLVMALAEVLEVFPVMIRRVRLRVGVMYLAFALALGKTAGAFIYFWNQP